MSDPTPPDLGMESMPVIITPPPCAVPCPTPRDWPPAIEITAPPTATTENITTIQYGPDPTSVCIVGLALVVGVMQFVLMRHAGRRR